MFTILFALFAFTAGAQDMSEPIRYFNSKPITLQPVFNWWTNAEAINTKNKRLPKSKKKVELPARVMPAWVRITSSEITNTGVAWVASAKIQETPGGPTTNILVNLRHGPFGEITQLNSAVAQYKEATATRNNAMNYSQSENSRASALNERANLYNEMGNIAPRSGFRSAASDYSQASSQARRNAYDANKQMNNLDAQREYLGKITQGRSVFHIDTFALRTGQIYAGLPVYDLGYSARR